METLLAEDFSTELDVSVVGPRKMIQIAFGDFTLDISETIVTGWLIIVVLFILMKWLTKDLKVVPETKRQVIAEYIVEFFNNTVKEMMGESMVKFAPYIATIFTFALTGALVSILGFRSMTVDINCTGTWAVMTFVLITYYKLKNNGAGGYLKSFAEPVIFITPINILSEVATPLAMALRMFGNMASGMIITSIVYAFLTVLSNVVYNALSLQALEFLNYFHIFQIGIPAALSIYFDFFSGVIQSYVFIMLTMVYVGQAAGANDA
ncbi:MAG: F0F1 ATP synthase subunit A [Oscillospiraceae bacterium]|nr:F0F1 ATP synthase subunit A [Oscillospiraceae bacterium]